MRIPLFRIWYSTTYTILFIILLVLLALTPGDQIYQSFEFGRRRNLFVVVATYALTALLTISIYATRLYTNRVVLQSIPKHYVPIEPGEVSKPVRRIIAKNLERSALIAWDSRPRDIRPEIQEHGRTGTPGSMVKEQRAVLKKKGLTRDATIMPIQPENPPWGVVAHPGWSSPASEDLTDLHYWTVITELPNLIEAKAVSLAPPDPLLSGDGPDDVVPNATFVAMLQRPAAAGLRDYLAQLAALGLVDADLGENFLTQYEYARFSTTPLTEREFRELTAVFAEILMGMAGFDAAILADTAPGTETSSIAPSEARSTIHYHVPHPVTLTRSVSTFSGNTSTNDGDASPITMRTAPSQRRAASGLQNMRRTSTSTVSTSSVRRHPPVHDGPASMPDSSASSLHSANSVIHFTPASQLEALPDYFAPVGG